MWWVAGPRCQKRNVPVSGAPGSALCGGGSSKVMLYRIQIRELESQLGQLESERSALARRATFAEEQLSAMQAYVDDNLGKYQREIVRLRGATRYVTD